MKVYHLQLKDASIRGQGGRARAYKKFVKIDIKEEWEGKRSE
jgi:hypothetical protein